MPVGAPHPRGGAIPAVLTGGPLPRGYSRCPAGASSALSAWPELMADVGIVRTQLALALRLSSVDEQCEQEDWADLFRRLCRHRPHRHYLDFTDFAAAVRQESCRHPDTPLGHLSPSTVDALWRSASSVHRGENRMRLADFIGLLSDISARHSRPTTKDVWASESATLSQRKTPTASRQTQCW